MSSQYHLSGPEDELEEENWEEPESDRDPDPEPDYRDQQAEEQVLEPYDNAADNLYKEEEIPSDSDDSLSDY